MIIELVASVFVSCLGAAVVSVSVKGWDLVRRRRKRVCSVAGTFISEFEGRHARAAGARQAITKLFQQGHQVHGVTREIDTERTWLLRGQIDAQGFFRGTYSSAQAPERSLGNFLLAIDQAALTLNGLWSHGDTRSQEVTGGRYWMRRCA